MTSEARKALEAARLFIASEYASGEAETYDEWLAPEARKVYTEVCDALAAAPQVEQPVAWRYRFRPEDKWTLTDSKPDADIIPTSGSIEPLYASPAPSPDAVEALETYYARQIEWSRETFGPALRTNGVINHIRKELNEIEADPRDLSEWVDVIILAMDGFWRHGGTVSDLMPRLLAKQQKNMARTWPDWRTMSEDRAIEHDRSGEATALPVASPGVTEAILVEAGKMFEAAGIHDSLIPVCLGIVSDALTAAQTAQPGWRTGRAEIEHDGFCGDIIGGYVTREGKRGVVVQQDGTRVVHVYGEKWLPASASPTETQGW